jgi:ferredoxin
MRLTAAVKNQFGCVVGLNKKMFHAKHPQVDYFAAMLVDLNLFLKPRLYILDAIVSMEGNGPRGGAPRRTGILMISADPVALDATASRLVGLEPDQVPTNQAGQDSGLGVYRLEDIELLGDNLDELMVKDFNLGIGLPGFAIKNIWLRNQIVPRPQIHAELCKTCGLCINACPLRPPAVDWSQAGKDEPPQYNYATCIRCYCCQEVCPEGAITLTVPWLGRILGRRIT